MCANVRDRNVPIAYSIAACKLKVNKVINPPITGREDIVKTLSADDSASGLIMEVNIFVPGT